MSDTRWAMIRPHEDRTVVFLDEERFAELAEDIANGESGVTEWLTEVPGERDPQYWPERTALLIKFEVLKPPALSGGPTGGTPEPSDDADGEHEHWHSSAGLIDG